VGAIFQQDHCELAIEAMPGLLLPRKGRLGLRDYEKMFCPDLKKRRHLRPRRRRPNKRAHGRRATGQYVAHVLTLYAFAELGSFFEGFMLEG
jgi:phenol 2-monooxygenase